MKLNSPTVPYSLVLKIKLFRLHFNSFTITVSHLRPAIKKWQVKHSSYPECHQHLVKQLPFIVLPVFSSFG